MSAEIHLRPTEATDGLAVYKLAKSSVELESTPCSSFYSLCGDFSHTSIVAEINGRIIGFVGGYRPPERENTLVVKTVVVDQEVRKMGLASEMLSDLVSRLSTVGVVTLEAIAKSSSEVAAALFNGYAEKHSVEVSKVDYLTSEQLDGGDAEVKYIIKLK